MNSIFFSSVLWVMQKASQIFKKSSNWKCSIWILSTPRESICKTTHPAQTTIHVISHQHVSKNHIHTAINEFVGKNEFFCILLKLASELAFQFLVWHSWHVDSRRDCEWTNSQSWKNQTKNIPTQADQNHDSFWLFWSWISWTFLYEVEIDFGLVNRIRTHRAIQQNGRRTGTFVRIGNINCISSHGKNTICKNIAVFAFFSLFPFRIYLRRSFSRRVFFVP